MEIPQAFHSEAIVRLKDGDFSHFYGGQATYGCRAKVDGTKDDNLGLPMVHITWDRNDWRYNGAEDGWTYPEHFDLVEEVMTEEPSDNFKDLMKQIEAAAAKLQDLSEAQSPEEEAKEPKSRFPQLFGKSTKFPPKASEALEPATLEKQTPMTDEQRAAIEEAMAAILDSEAFVVVTVARIADKRAPKGMLKPEVRPFTLTPEAALLATSYMGTLAAQAHQKLAIQAITDSTE